MTSLLDYRRSDYGDGVFRRHLHIQLQSSSKVSASLEDEAHAFSLTLEHDGNRVSAIASHWHRHPLNTCEHAGLQLQDIVGTPLTGNLLNVRDHTDSVEHCTHFFDLASLMITHAYRWIQNPDLPRAFLYKAYVTDVKDDKNKAELYLNDKRMLSWLMEDGIIRAPTEFDGVSPLKGFTGWAVENLSLDALEKSLILQKGIFVSRARIFRMEDLAGLRVKGSGQAIGVCYATRQGREDEAIRTGSREDYSDAEEQMLKFV